MILNNNRSIQTVLSNVVTTYEAAISVDYVDIDPTAVVLIPAAQISTTNGNVAVTILNAPVSPYMRKINSINAVNNDTLSINMTMSIYDSVSTLSSNLITVGLAPNEILGYTDTEGWYVIDVTGSRKFIFSANVILAGDTSGTGTVNSTITTTLATVNTNVGTFGDTLDVPQFTVNAKGLITSASNVHIFIPSAVVTVTGGDLTLSGNTGTNITNATLATVNTNIGQFGDSTHIAQHTVNAKGLITQTANIAIGTLNQNTTGSANNASYLGGIPSANFVTTTTLDNNTLPASFTSLIVSGAAIGTVGSLSVSGNAIAVNMANATNFAVTLQATTTQTLSNPTNVTAGTSGQIAITQNAAPSLLSFGTSWYSINGTNIISSVAGSVTLLTYYVVDATHIWYGLGTGAATVGNIMLTGDASVNGVLGANTTITLATVNSNIGMYGDATHIPQYTINAKGLTTTSGNIAIGTLNQNTTGSANNASYLGGVAASGYQVALGFTPYNATNPSGYITGITSGSIYTALGYTPYDGGTNYNGFISTLNQSMIITALTYTPYNATNPSGYITPTTLDNNTLPASFTSVVTSGDLQVGGNLIIFGNTTTIESQTLTVTDANITLGNVATPSNVTAIGGGINLLGATTKTFEWQSASSGWNSSEYITAPGFIGNLTGTATSVTTNANLTGDVTSVGNATTLATVNSNTGQYGDSTHISQHTVNAKGLITQSANIAIGTLNQNTTGSANNASYLGGVPAAGYQVAGTYVTPTTLDNNTLPASFTSLAVSGSVPTWNQNTTGSANNASYLGGVPASGYQLAGEVDNLTGDVTSVGLATTLATVNSNIGTFGNATLIPSFVVNAKGLITSASNVSVTIPSGSISVTGSDITMSGSTGTAITNATLATVNSNTGAFGDSTHVATFTVNAKGLTTAAGNVAIGTLNQNTTGSANSASYLGSNPAASYVTYTGATGNVNIGTNYFLGNGSALTGITTSPGNLTGDVTSVGLATTLATVNSNTGMYGDATHIPQYTVNAKGLTTTSGNIAIGTLNQNTTGSANNASYLGGTPAAGYATNLTGDITSVVNATTLATVNSNTGAYGDATHIATFTVNGKGLTTAAANVAIGTLNQNTTGTAANLSGTPALPAGTTATTQSPADGTTKLATTAYVDSAVLGQNFKEAVKYATTAALPAVVYNNGTSGVGATLTEVGFGAVSFDGSTPSVGDRVLVKNQVSTFQNGIYTVTVVGTGAAVFVLTRAVDSNQTTEYKTGDSVFTTSGTANATTTWAYTGIDSPVMGTDAITLAQTAGQGSFTSGNGITITGVSIAIDTSVTVDKTTAQTLTNKTLTSPTFTAPVLGTPASGSAANLTSFPTLNQNTTGSANNASYLGGVAAAGYATNLTGDITSVVNATTLATVNSNTGMYGDATHIPQYTVNAKGLTTTSGNIAIGTLNQNTTGSANNASYLGGVPSANYLLTTGSATNLTSFPTLNQDTTGKSAKSDALNSATTIVNVSSATAPSSGQVLTATSSTAATWQTPSGGGSSAWPPVVSNITALTYTLTLTDANTFVTMSNASSQTLTIPTNANVAFVTGTEIDVLQDGTGDVVIAPDTGVTILSKNSYTQLATQYSWANLVKKTTNIWWLYGDLIVSSYSVSYLTVGGGGGGGSGANGSYYGGGGGGGYMTSGTAAIATGTVYSITIGGGGGSGGYAPGASGVTSYFSTIASAAGGGGGNRDGGNSGSYTGGANGGLWGGGGAGFGANGGNASGGGGGSGGNGLQSSITGSSVYYAGGGGSPSGQPGGLGGGGGEATPGTANTGGGGGGSYGGTANGGSGVIIISVPTAKYSGISTGSPTITTSGSNTIIKFTASGSYTG